MKVLFSGVLNPVVTLHGLIRLMYWILPGPSGGKNEVCYLGVLG